MKSPVQKMLLLGLVAAGSANAADIVPTQFKAVETDLARSELQLDNPYSMRFGVNFTEGHRYLMHPSTQNVEASSSIRREFNYSLMLPYSVEAGLSLYDTQQGSSENLTHKKQRLGGAVYARYHLVQNESLRSSITLQFEPGTADRYSFHQASQDKTGLLFAIDGTPIENLQVGAYLGMTKREDEKFRYSRINDEVLYGLRLSAGPESIKLFADMQIRSLPWTTRERGDTMQTGRHYEIGLQGSYADLHLQVSKYIPTSERFVGEPERGFKIALNYLLGKKSSPSTQDHKSEAQETEENLEKIEESLEKDNSKDLKDQAKPEEPKFESTETKEEGLGPIPVVDDGSPKATDELKKNPQVIEAAGKDEFEKWDATQAEESKRPETAGEKAEREYREQLAREKANEKTKAAEAKSAEQVEQERLLKELADEEKKAKESAADIEKELNEYTLPGPDEVNWDGLGNR